jgi:hypothetical protein
MPHSNLYHLSSLTFRVITKGLQQVGGLADGAIGFLEHVEQETQFTQQAQLANAGRGCVLQRQIPHQGSKMQ